jgi:hypothetical protein
MFEVKRTPPDGSVLFVLRKQPDVELAFEEVMEGLAAFDGGVGVDDLYTSVKALKRLQPVRGRSYYSYCLCLRVKN